jgi:hypothetical protein
MTLVPKKASAEGRWARSRVTSGIGSTSIHASCGKQGQHGIREVLVAGTAAVINHRYT